MVFHSLLLRRKLTKNSQHCPNYIIRKTEKTRNIGQISMTNSWMGIKILCSQAFFSCILFLVKILLSGTWPPQGYSHQSLTTIKSINSCCFHPKPNTPLGEAALLEFSAWHHSKNGCLSAKGPLLRNSQSSFLLPRLLSQTSPNILLQFDENLSSWLHLL